MASDPLGFVIGAAPPPRLDKALARDAPEAAALSRTRLARLIADGAVRVGGVVVQDATARVAEGDRIDIALPAPCESHMAPEAIALDIAYEDDDLIVIDKPAGMVVHPAPGSASGTLVNALLHHCGARLSGVGGERRPGIVHRLDKDTSGLLVVAKSDAAHQGLAAQFAAHTVERAYLALVHGVPEAGDPRLAGLPGGAFEADGALVIRTQIARHRTDRQRQAVVATGGRHAVTRVRLRERFGRPPAAALVECRLETGRTHQIRVHLAHAGHGLSAIRSMAAPAACRCARCPRARSRRRAISRGRRCTPRASALSTRAAARCCGLPRRCPRTWRRSSRACAARMTQGQNDVRFRHIRRISCPIRAWAVLYSKLEYDGRRVK